MEKFDDEFGDLSQFKILSFEDVNKGFVGKDPFEAIRKDMCKNQRCFFMDQAGIAMGANYISNKPTSLLFNSTGKNEQGIEGYEYLVTTYRINDGAKVYAQYESQKNNEARKHILDFYFEKEKSGKNNLFGDFYIARIGSSFKGIIDNFQKSNNYGISAKIGNNIVPEVNSFDSLTRYVQTAAYYNTRDTLDAIKTKDAILFEYYSMTGTTQVLESLSNIDKGIAEGINWCGDKLGELLFTEKNYDPANKEYNPIIPISTLLPGKSAAINLFKEVQNNEFLQGAEAAFEQAYKTIKNVLKKIGKIGFDALPESIKNVIRKIRAILMGIQETVQDLGSSVSALLDKITDYAEEALKTINAILCGILNGLIGLIQVICYILAFLVDFAIPNVGYKGYLENRNLGEQLESVLDFISDEYTTVTTAIKDLFNSDKDFDFSFINKSIDALGEFWTNTSRYKIAYWIGIGLFELIINIVLLVFTGGLGNVAKAGTYLEKAFAFAKVVGRETLSVATFGVVDLLGLLRKFFLKFATACKRGFRGLCEYLNEIFSGLLGTKKTKKLEDLAEEVQDIEAVIVRGQKP